MIEEKINYRELAPDRKYDPAVFSLQSLEYQKIIELLAAEAMSRPGRELCLELKPSSELAEVKWRLAETSDFISYLLARSDLALSSVDEIRPLIRRLDREIVPFCDELNKVARFLRVVRDLKKNLPPSDSDNYQEEMARPVYQLLSALFELTDCRSEIERCVASDEDLYDDASAELKQIRRQLIRTQDEVKIVLERLIRKQSDDLQDSLVTLRNGRYVLPVKAAHKNAIKGLVHDSSASGQTLFVEPLAVVELNNKLRELEFEESKEVERILRQLGEFICNYQSELIANAELLAALDFAQAKARLALKLEAHCPKVNAEGRIRLKAARHPLIPAADVVPIDFELGYDFDSLLITGPNTGGKTVSLKTCGLLSLMAMSGLALPTAAGSEVSVFKEVLADIGDEQSIEQSLSTFSSHLKNLIKMLSLTGPDSLVLCDELGSGTDPSEGAALAIALVDAFRRKGAKVVATTHYQELKGYALNTPGVSNACCEFDTQTLRPTYRLLIGVPGVSNALAIALRLGLDSSIIEHAKALVSDEGHRFEELISAIEQSKQQAVKMETEISELHTAAKELEARLAKRESEIAEKEKSLIAEAEDKAYQIIEAARAEVAAEIRQKEQDFARFKEQLESADKSERKLQEQELSALRSAQSKLQKKSEKRASALGKKALSKGVKRALKAEDIVIGQYYRAPALNFVGQAVSEVDRRGQLQLAKGQIKLNVPLAGLEEAEAPRLKEQKFNQSAREIRSAAQQTVCSEIKLIGLRVEEALSELDKAIDLALLTNLDSLRVVHGKGSGALRSAVRSKAASDSRVAGYREAGFGEGDSGVTYLDLKKS
ncbi:MAG: endonuclease MutS2 [Eubacteriales bacterium]|nr:endonuclease MutS2 [Eubacteriales bacterium]